MNINTISRIFLAPSSEEDLFFLFQCRNSFDFREYCSLRKRITSLESFKKELENDLKYDRRDQQIIYRAFDKTRIGVIFLYALSIAHQNAFVTIYLLENEKNKGYGAEAFALYIMNAMKRYKLHKILTDVYSHNKGIVNLLIKGGFVIEGIFKEQRKNQNQQWVDVYRLALFSENTEKLRKFLDKLDRT